MANREEDVMQAYRDSIPDESRLFNRTRINQVAWTLIVLLCGLVFWMAIALINAENQRNALINKQCRDRVFPEEIDKACIVSVHSREHWWEHLAYAMWHTSPQR